MKILLSHFFSFFGIDIRRFLDWRYLCTLLFLLSFAVLVAYKQTALLGIQTDFAVFWHAGNNFDLGNGLYSNIGGADRFIYPPFAAWCFQLFPYLTMPQAGFAWCFFNFGLYAAIIRLLYHIFLYYNLDKKKLKIAISIAMLLSFRYFWYHQQYVQMNLLMLYLCLEGIFAYLKKEESKAIFFLVFASFIKILPVFFLFWIFCRGNYKSLLKIFAISLVFVLIPIVSRGLEQGFYDHLNYYTAFLEPFQQGRVEPKLNNYSLSAMIYKWCLPVQDSGFQLIKLDFSKVQKIYQASFLLLLFTFFYLIWRSRKYFTTPHFYEIGFIFCLIHLLSGISWEYHFVSLLFVFVPFGMFLQEKKRTLLLKIQHFLLLVLAILVGFDGQDTIGKVLHLYFNHYCAITILTLILLIFNLKNLLKQSDNVKENSF